MTIWNIYTNNLPTILMFDKASLVAGKKWARVFKNWDLVTLCFAAFVAVEGNKWGEISCVVIDICQNLQEIITNLKND